MRFVGIGLVAGLLSALFGVGGGLLVVPLLVYQARFELREAAGTSLAAIGVTALAGAVTFALHGELKPGAAAIVGLPAAAGALIGVALQQRLATRWLTLAFAGLLAGLGTRLVVG